MKPRTLTLEDEEAMVLDTVLDAGVRTTRVQVIVTYVDDRGAVYAAERIVKMHLKRGKP